MSRSPQWVFSLLPKSFQKNPLLELTVITETTEAGKKLPPVEDLAAMLGLSRQTATDFSFFLGIPTLIGAGAYSLYKERALLSMDDLPLFSVGLVFAFVSAWLCVRWLIRYVSSHNFVPFAWYRIAFGIFILVSANMGWVTWAE